MGIKDRFKKTERVDGVRFTTHVGPDDPTHQGVMDARDVLGGRFPDHVGRIIIRPGMEGRPDKGYVLNGRCTFNDGGGSTVEIFAGSIRISAEDDDYETRRKAARTTLHEIGHSVRAEEMRKGAWLDKEPSRSWEEEDANAFVNDALADNRARKRAGRPQLTRQELHELRMKQSGRS